MTAASIRRFAGVLASLLVAACANTAPDASPEVPIAEQKLASFAPQFADQPFDFRCGECEFMDGSNGCQSVRWASMVVRVTKAQQRVLEDRCDSSSEDDFSSSCRARVVLALQEAEVVMPARGASPPPETVAAGFSYVSHPSEIPQIPALQPLYLFLMPNARPDQPGTHYAMAMCPRLP